MRFLRRLAPVLVLGLLLFLYMRPPKPTRGADRLGRLRFVDVAEKSGIGLVNVCGDPRRWYIPESNGNGAAWFDLDDDGDLDLFIGNGAHMEYVDDGRTLKVVHDASSKLYRNDGFMRFEDISVQSGAARTDWINSVTVGDVDNDGDEDIYLGCFGPDVFLRREGTRFVDSTRDSGLGNELWAAGAAFGDANRDGFLDLYVANYCLFDLEHPPAEGKRERIQGVEVAWGPEAENQRGYNLGAPDVYYLNDGKGAFHDWTEQAGFTLEKPRCSYACVWSDVDDDGWPDLLVANDLQPANLFHNLGAGRFKDEALERGFALNAEGKPTSSMGLLVEDVDGDGDFDVLRTNFDLEANCLHVNDGTGHFSDMAGTYGLAAPSVDVLGWGGAFLDADRDGDLDLLIANGHVYPQAEKIGMHPWLEPTQLFEGVPHRHYGTVWQEVTADAGPGLAAKHSARGLAVGDADNDGDPDVLIVDLDERARLLRNESLNLGHWIGLKLTGKYSNRDAIGAKVTIRAGERSWTREVRTTNGLYCSHDPRVLIGLGEAKDLDSVTIRWPNGNLQVETHPPLDHYLSISERGEPTR